MEAGVIIYPTEQVATPVGEAAELYSRAVLEEPTARVSWCSRRVTVEQEKRERERVLVRGRGRWKEQQKDC